MAAKTILIVEDDLMTVTMLDDLFADAGYITLTAQNGAEALAILAGTLPDLILTDLLMPVMDGLALCRAVLANTRTRRLPLIIMSAVYDLHFSIDFPIAGFLLKPFEIDTMLKLVAEAMR